ncbi:uncharacterized protein Bfra_004567 [Botrytis fragariae]|uniref:F-box domain-containing protein n=1 Tax=Botrytis fragariae TaxID=1964551 RepID=A0A8H6AVM0_9HELO|nr:uncharacterized protein Bfra_004567 [Botrytis fragariae]KAF5874556.1 hypothetical protein Bfra_004567 [Botrytis fragariae]
MFSSDDSDIDMIDINDNQTKYQQGSRCISRRKPKAMTKSKKSALDKLPLEVRRMIYKELLVNPVLGTMKAIEADTEFGVEATYGLTPAILRTCRSIYEEASEVLYDQTFIIKCDYNYRGGSLGQRPVMSCPCPILRYRYKLTPPLTRLEIPVKSSAMTQARSWKVLIDSSVDDIDYHQQFYEFCRAVCDARPKKIEIVMLKTGTGPPNAAQVGRLGICRTWNPWETLAPLTMLRNVGKLTIRNEYPPFLHEIDGFNPDAVVWNSNEPGKLLTRMLQNLVQSDRPVERIFQMREKLVILAESFERYLPFKMDMNFRAPLTMRGNLRSHPEDIHELIQFGYKRYTEYDVPNPHRNKDGNNDLEESLFGARNADLTVQNSNFKQHREEVVKQLRLQYKRLVDASNKLKSFKSERDQFWGRKDAAFAHWLLLIEKYAAEFERKKNPDTAAEFRRQKRRFDNLRATWPREVMLAKLDRMMEDRDFGEFETVALKVEEDMDKQVAGMTAAWRDLFKADVYKERFCQYKFDVAALRRKRVVRDLDEE